MDIKTHMKGVLSPNEYKWWLEGFNMANFYSQDDSRKQQPKKDTPELQSIVN